jgi:transposase
LKDGDNQRLLDGIGLQHDRGNLLRFLHEPHVEPTNNRGERALRPAVIARGLSHGSKNGRGAEAFAAFTSVLQTAVKNRVSSTIDTLHNLFRSNSKPRDAPVPP